LDTAERPTAIIAQSDLLAVGVIAAAHELGLRVPEDLSVVGFDGVRLEGGRLEGGRLEGVAPHDLTTMVQPAVAKGRAAGQAAIALLEGSDVAGETFTSAFHVGSTTAPPPRS